MDRTAVQELVARQRAFFQSGRTRDAERVRRGRARLARSVRGLGPRRMGMGLLVWGAAWVSLTVAGADERCPPGQVFQHTVRPGVASDEGCATRSPGGGYLKQGVWETRRTDGRMSVVLTYADDEL